MYAHFGRTQDYDALKAAGIDVQGSILLVRMGQISLPAIVTIAGNQGAAGVITYKYVTICSHCHLRVT